MPVVNPPESLLKLSLEAICRNVKEVVTVSADVTECADDVLQVAEEKLQQVLIQKQNEDLACGVSSPSDNLSQNTFHHLKSLKTLLKKRVNCPQIVGMYLEHLPPEFLNEILTKVIGSIAETIVYDEEQIENFMADKCSYFPRMKVAFNFLMKGMLFPTVSCLNISPVTNTLFNFFAKFLLKHGAYKKNSFVNTMNTKKKEVFSDIFLSYKKELVYLTSLSLQNLAHGELVWLICCYCPNLWHLDISGELFDLQRYCVTEVSAGQHVRAVNKNGTRNYQEADFVDAICGLYGNHSLPHKTYGGIAKGCLNLKTLLLPECVWERQEEVILLEEIKELLLLAPYIEEITGICLLYILCKLNELEYPPIMLKFKKFNGKTGGQSLVGVAPNRLKNVHLPFVSEVNMSLNVFMPPVTLDLFPNMRHLTVTPYDYRAYNFDTILPYLKNLHTLDMELTHELSISNMCDIAEHCKLLESLTLTCPALRMQAVDLDEDLIFTEQSKSVSPLSALINDAKSKDKDEYESLLILKRSLPEYAKVLLKIDPEPYEKDNRFVPNFQRLHTLQFFGIRSVEAAAFYKCIKGSPMVHTLTFAAQDIGDDFSIELDDDFVGRIAPMLKKLRHIKFFAEDDQKLSIPIENLTNLAIEHILRFCFDIRSIGNLASWNILPDEIDLLNFFFKKSNFILRVY